MTTITPSAFKAVVTELEALEAKATPGPWAWDQRGEKTNEWGLGVAMREDETPIDGRFADDDAIYVDYVCSHEAATCNYADPAFICALRNHWPTIRAALESASIPGLTVAGESDVRDLDTPAVRFYERDFYPLSNFSAFTVWWRGCCFQTSEHAYHWAKFPQPDHQVAIIHSISAHEAFKYAERHRQDRHSDWDTIKVNVMRDILHAKAGQHEYVRRKLLQTGDRLLIEDSWRDDFWGWGPNRDGQNMLGKLWMEIRSGMTQALTTAPGKEGR